MLVQNQHTDSEVFDRLMQEKLFFLCTFDLTSTATPPLKPAKWNPSVLTHYKKLITSVARKLFLHKK
jgi:hypothetical protein